LVPDVHEDEAVGEDRQLDARERLQRALQVLGRGGGHAVEAEPHAAVAQEGVPRVERGALEDPALAKRGEARVDGVAMEPRARGQLPHRRLQGAPGEVARVPPEQLAQDQPVGVVEAHQATTSASANPSCPLEPTVWIAVALTLGSRDSISRNVRVPRALGSPLSASRMAPSRTTLSPTMRLPLRASRSAHSRYCGLLGLSASRNTRSKGPSRVGRVSSAGPTLTSTRSASPARARFRRATSACFGSASSVTRCPSCGRARASQIAL